MRVSLFFYCRNSLRQIYELFSAKKNKKVSKICLSVLLPYCNPSVLLLPRYMVTSKIDLGIIL